MPELSIITVYTKFFTPSRYFQPPYNIEYKDTFPNPAHSTYSECYDLDINSICIEVETENVNCRLFSKTIPVQWWHMHSFALHSSLDRRSMFEFDKPFNIVNSSE